MCSFARLWAGLGIGSLAIDAQGDIQHENYWPFGVFSQSLFNRGSFSASGISEDPSRNFFVLNEAGRSDGMFAFRTSTGGVQQDAFVSFQGNAVIFASFQTVLPIQGYAADTYYYGVGLK